MVDLSFLYSNLSRYTAGHFNVVILFGVSESHANFIIVAFDCRERLNASIVRREDHAASLDRYSSHHLQARPRVAKYRNVDGLIDASNVRHHPKGRLICLADFNLRIVFPKNTQEVLLPNVNRRQLRNVPTVRPCVVV